MRECGNVAELERVGEENGNYSNKVLVKHPEWGAIFGRFEDLEVGAKIGKGGRAEIFVAPSQSFHPRISSIPDLVN